MSLVFWIVQEIAHTLYKMLSSKPGPLAATISKDHVYERPTKLIKSFEDMKIWEKSEAYFEYLGFILAINEAVKGKSNSRGSENCSENVLKIVDLLDKLDKKIEEAPPIEQPQRFGNQAFRTWYQKLKDESLELLQGALPVDLLGAIPEIVNYLVDGFGNSTRIDYGTGHEISFIMFLCCLFKIGFLVDSDRTATGCKIFVRYLDLARKLQQVYRMEPAGSHGVWSLDDYQFVPFIWGSSQLFAHPVIEPPLFLQKNILDAYGDDYMFLTCIRYINSVKTGPFAEHSNQLWSISGVPSWSKINSGLIKMYKVEVLSKFPVVQHIVFGSLFTLKAVEQSTGLITAKTSMIPPPRPGRPDHTPKTPSHVSSTGTIHSGGSGQSGQENVENEKQHSLTTLLNHSDVSSKLSQRVSGTLSAKLSETSSRSGPQGSVRILARADEKVSLHSSKDLSVRSPSQLPPETEDMTSRTSSIRSGDQGMNENIISRGRTRIRESNDESIERNVEEPAEGNESNSN